MSTTELIVIVAVVLVLVVAGAALLTRSRRSSARQDLRAVEHAVHHEPAESATEAPAKEAAEDRDPRAGALEARPPIVEPGPGLRARLGKSRRFLSEQLAVVFGGVAGEDTWEDLETVLIQADVGVGVATRITGDLKVKARERRITDGSELRSLLAETIVEIFEGGPERSLVMAPNGPSVWMVVGVNGTGKTTTIGKLARDLTQRGRTVALAAADTFRAAADEQLGVWGQRSGAHVVRHQPGGDPAAVAFDAYQYARARDYDMLIVDTAGRLHTKIPLMDELAKVRRVIEKQGAVHEVLLVLDATAGQNGLVQARQFADALGVTGIVLTKLDGTARGGIAIAVEESLGLPIKLVGVGEGIDDLEPFDPKIFVDALI